MKNINNKTDEKPRLFQLHEDGTLLLKKNNYGHMEGSASSPDEHVFNIIFIAGCVTILMGLILTSVFRSFFDVYTILSPTLQSMPIMENTLQASMSFMNHIPSIALFIVGVSLAICSITGKALILFSTKYDERSHKQDQGFKVSGFGRGLLWISISLIISSQLYAVLMDVIFAKIWPIITENNADETIVYQIIHVIYSVFIQYGFMTILTMGLSLSAWAIIAVAREYWIYRQGVKNAYVH
ncbi:hypothetical protein SOD_p00330 (plasmid) [Serratia plymuthica 4Rx13]|uniref:Uncharacterized protein n=1 Tax=Serratia plymuthica TaxID=82996 RepID=A0A318NS36_SERPL|nr:hypothetical protein [Serratia plymuthica]AGO57707.1 hypothetical protein SOD_p00330 [Serratia plymuthica 4Rx13]PYD36599.1 hypothetical protein CT690_23935 [Serratia plymuthica]